MPSHISTGNRHLLPFFLSLSRFIFSYFFFLFYFKIGTCMSMSLFPSLLDSTMTFCSLFSPLVFPLSFGFRFPPPFSQIPLTSLIFLYSHPSLGLTSLAQLFQLPSPIFLLCPETISIPFYLFFFSPIARPSSLLPFFTSPLLRLYHLPFSLPSLSHRFRVPSLLLFSFAWGYSRLSLFLPLSFYLSLCLFFYPVCVMYAFLIFPPLL